MEHLALEIFNRIGNGSKFANLPDNASITITDSSIVFSSGTVWSLSFTLNVYANAHIFGSAGELHGALLHEQVDKRMVRLWADGLPLLLGYLKLDDDVEVDEKGDVDVTFESGQKTFDEMIEGAKANQVPMLGDVQIGLALWRKRWLNYAMTLEAQVYFADGKDYKFKVKQGDYGYVKFSADGEDDTTPTQQYPRLVYPKGTFYDRLTNSWDSTIDFLNTDSPYTEDEDGTPTHPFCNVALCYQKQGYEKTDENGNVVPKYNEDPEAQRGYEYMPANRVNSAPNFFVAYWIRALMKHLNIHIEENQMMNVEDLRRLFFVNTNCAYRLPDSMRNEADFNQYGKYTSFDADMDESAGRGTTKDYVGEYHEDKPYIEVKESGLTCTSYQGEASDNQAKYFSPEEKTVTKVSIIVKDVKVWGGHEEDSDIDRNLPYLSKYLHNNRFFHKAFATSECFPNVDVSDVIHALENGFGIRFIFCDDYRKVRIVLLRNLFRNGDVQELKCDIISQAKEENHIYGFRLTYGNSEDTHFYYKGFADKLPHQKELWPDTSDTHDYSQWNLNADYAKIIQKATAFDKTCYVTPNTGMAFGIKIDKDAKRYEELHPSTFEYAGFMDAEDGDCTGDEDTISTINMGFTPAIMNDLNMDEEREGVAEQRFALFVDETMRPRRPDLGKRTAPESYNDSEAEYDADLLYTDDRNSPFRQMRVNGIVQPGLFSIKSDMFASANGVTIPVSRHRSQIHTYWNLSANIEGHLNEGYRLYLQDNYEPNDDGISPIETHDWGLTLGIMRGSGSAAYVDYSFDEDDGEGNDTWDIVPGSNATAHPDTCDNYGNLWDYNGSDGPTVHCNTPAEAKNAMLRLWPNSNIDLIHQPNTSGRTQAIPDERDIDSYIAAAQIQSVNNHLGQKVSLLFASATKTENLYTGYIQDYAKKFKGMTPTQMFAYDAGREGFGILVEVGSSMERLRTLLALQEQAFANGFPVIIDGGDNGVGVTEGRCSLKLRAEKPNPFFDPKQPESTTNRRYLKITNPNLRGRGLMDQFYKEYSYWIRNARIAKMTVRMTLTQLLSIDKTVRVTVGDITGFIRKLEYTISKESGLGNVKMEIMYI